MTVAAETTVGIRHSDKQHLVDGTILTKAAPLWQIQDYDSGSTRVVARAACRLRHGSNTSSNPDPLPHSSYLLLQKPSSSLLLFQPNIYVINSLN